MLTILKLKELVKVVDLYQVFVAYILLYPMYKLFFKFEIVCMLHCQVMEDFIKLPPYLQDLYETKRNSG